MKIGTFEEVRKDHLAGVVDYTRDGKCSGCGECCTNILPMNDEEISRIRQYIRKHGIRAEKNLPPLSSAYVDMTCPFRNNREHKCNIYEVRPEICKACQCDRAKTEVTLPEEMIRQGRRKIILVRQEFYGRGD